MRNQNFSNKDPQTNFEFQNGGFFCTNCNFFIPINKEMSTKNRNHCPKCLYSKHVDDEQSGDRKSKCFCPMKPVSLTLKKVKTDKYKKEQFGELMIVHECTGCQKLSINRIAADDTIETLKKLFQDSLILSDEYIKRLEKNEITIISNENKSEVDIQLFGKQTN